MTDESINAAIRECTGMSVNFVSDLNAMHEAELTLHPADRCAYVEKLGTLVPARDIDGLPFLDGLVMATARQRAEAFVKTLGKWKATGGKV